MAQSCPAVDVSDQDRLWSFCPSKTGAAIMAVVFALVTVAHFFQMFFHRKPYCLVVVIAAALQTVSYIFRYISIDHPTDLGPYAVQFVGVLIAPIFTNAFVYMVFGRMVWNFTNNAKIGGIKPWRFGLIFVLLDILSFFVQIIGGIKTANPRNDYNAVMTGIHIYMGGIGIQQFFILVFFFFAFNFHRTMNREGGNPRMAYMLLYALYFALLMITVRVIFRLAEFGGGTKGPTMTHEIYQYLLDTLPMFLANIVFNFVHPGSIMAGRDGNFPSRKERKNGVLTKTKRNMELSSTEFVQYATAPYPPTHYAPVHQ
ncbi:RTA1 like protein-domain-containing protein [Talaromyces proteolyticus]|uniref:RTA1 like protein-domain-containing protein n=1 Tax=Talaromyces proteolyticus TaxID=1131652 RepID=A0AAD4KSV7_9EURO|nr:RTA1 like protein-domain-containing protein [Talaromyces proteolyticus]KAH8698611.1 RTA1 like protein-domain-containing protein [Talaromyces proteolyticus]